MFFKSDIGIDLGTASVLVYIKGKGVVIQEPSVVAIDRDTNKLLAVGEDARRMLGRTPGNIIAIRPLKDGVISDYEVTQRMLKYFIEKAIGKNNLFLRPRIVVCVPSGITEVEKRAVIQASNQAGARKTYLIEEPIAAAIGADLDITEPRGKMIIDIGGGTTDVAVISLGGIVVNSSIKVGGNTFDTYITRYIRKKHNLMIGERSAEELKVVIGTAYKREKEVSMDIRGRYLLTGLPEIVQVTSSELLEALSEPLEAIVDAVKSVLEKTPPELASDIGEKGIMMTGGSSLLHGIDKLIKERTGIKVNIAEDPVSCVATGTGRSLESIDVLENI
ncbi:rod shape-determining protein MreB [Gottschalkia acidurici 9a]|uniref:Cell shape-determining protein MreB n=1 Tax=Gottschalkia acidurici (strain ATCC 7906 / DSM 604 / BCRC 14475 / CIP 104303 / KCTC 5404 / NCIMB 10678 / 9a) TaxID=1128398 RepID=K0AWY7_GOTA9|nr:rod shape-determining protein MreB [Gottschalkia acidurici]AFS77292.1 rod shape-determining protein MreB [Gottschalkia acidurici 9a]